MRAHRAPARRRDEAGAGILELVIAVAIVGILANITVPLALYALKRAQAQAIINDFLTVQQAAIQYNNDRGTYPVEYATSQEPVELRPYIKGRILWDSPSLGLTYDWENWERPDGQPSYPAFGMRIGFTIETTDAALMAMIMKQYPGPYVTTFRNTRATLAILK